MGILMREWKQMIFGRKKTTPNNSNQLVHSQLPLQHISPSFMRASKWSTSPINHIFRSIPDHRLVAKNSTVEFDPSYPLISIFQFSIITSFIVYGPLLFIENVSTHFAIFLKKCNPGHVYFNSLPQDCTPPPHCIPDTHWPAQYNWAWSKCNLISQHNNQQPMCNVVLRSNVSS